MSVRRSVLETPAGGRQEPVLTGSDPAPKDRVAGAGEEVNGHARAESDLSYEVAQLLGALHPFWSRALVYIVALFAGSALLWMWLGRIDVVASAPFRLVPLGQVRTIQAPRDGRVERIDVRQGDEVTRGDVVFRLRSRQTLMDLRELEQAKVRLAQARYEVDEALPRERKLLTETIVGLERRLKVARDLAEVHRSALRSFRRRSATAVSGGSEQEQSTAEADLEAEIRFRTTEIEHLDRRYSDSEKLHGKGLISRAQLDEARVRFFNSLAQLPARMGEINGLETTVHDLDRQILKVKLELQRISQQAHQGYEEALLAHDRALQAADRDLEAESDLILAPEAGTITQVLVNSDGQVVAEGQVLATFAPTSVPLVAEASIMDRDVGTVTLGQVVRLKYEAYPFADYGIRRGTLTAISPDAEVDAVLGPVFLGTIELDEDSIPVAGERRPLMYGMKGVAEIVIDRQSVLSLVLKPLREFRRSAAFTSEGPSN